MASLPLSKVVVKLRFVELERDAVKETAGMDESLRLTVRDWGLRMMW